MDTFFLILAFVAGFLLIFGTNLLLADIFESNRKRARKRLEEEMGLRQRERTRNELDTQKMRGPAGRSPSEGAVEMPEPNLWKRYVHFVEESGLRIHPLTLMALSLASGMIVAAIASVLSGKLILAALVMPLGGAVPPLYVAWARAKRLDKLLSQLPDAFDLMSRTLRAGQTTSQAIQSVADEFSAPIADEFGYCYDQQNLGLSPETAFRNLARRTGLLELKIFVLAVMIHRQTGGNFADLLEKLASVIRDRYRIQGVIKALTAEGRLQAIILLALPPSMLVILTLVARPYIETLFEMPILLLAMFGSMLIGALWMRRIINFTF